MKALVFLFVFFNLYIIGNSVQVQTGLITQFCLISTKLAEAPEKRNKKILTQQKVLLATVSMIQYPKGQIEVKADKATGLIQVFLLVPETQTALTA